MQSVQSGKTHACNRISSQSQVAELEQAGEKRELKRKHSPDAPATRHGYVYGTRSREDYPEWTARTNQHSYNTAEVLLIKSLKSKYERGSNETDYQFRCVVGHNESTIGIFHPSKILDAVSSKVFLV
jgi:hypothetical protein